MELFGTSLPQSAQEKDLKNKILSRIEARAVAIQETNKQELSEESEEDTENPKQERKRSSQDDPERLKRTVFVGNVPSKCCKDKKMQKDLKNLFKAHGPVESLRFRSLILSKAMPRKYAFISGQMDESAESVNAYVVMKSEEDAQKCLEDNAKLFYGHHLRIDIASNNENVPSHKKSVFIGNLPLNVSEETLWKTFSDCGTVASVRIVRDKKTSQGKGFAYVAFKERSNVKMALMMDGTEVGGRKIRVQKCLKPGQYPKQTKPKEDPRLFKRARPTAHNKGKQGNQKRPRIVKK